MNEPPSDLVARSDQQRLAELGSLAGALVHELKNPLGVIMLNAELIQQQLEGLGIEAPAQEKMSRRLARILSSARNLQAVADSFLGFARPSNPDPDAVDINQLLRELIDERSESDEAAQLQVTLHLDDNLPEVPADRLQLRSVFGNILKNAREALLERPRERRILVITRAAPNLARVMIANNGPAIPERVLARLFQPFTSGKDDGTGLGLAIVQRLVDLHHGRIEVSSDTQQGVTFTLEFPTTLGPAQPRPELPLPTAEAVVRDDDESQGGRPGGDSAARPASERARRSAGMRTTTGPNG
jgi:signal transduction histidine kinase